MKQNSTATTERLLGLRKRYPRGCVGQKWHQILYTGSHHFGSTNKASHTCGVSTTCIAVAGYVEGSVAVGAAAVKRCTILRTYGQLSGERVRGRGRQGENEQASERGGFVEISGLDNDDDNERTQTGAGAAEALRATADARRCRIPAWRTMETSRNCRRPSHKT